MATKMTPAISRYLWAVSLSFCSSCSICSLSVTSFTSDATPIMFPLRSFRGVLYHSQVIIFPAFVIFSLIPCVPLFSVSIFWKKLFVSLFISFGMIRLAAYFPTASCFVCPNIFSAAEFHSITLKSKPQDIAPTFVFSR